MAKKKKTKTKKKTTTKATNGNGNGEKPVTEMSTAELELMQDRLMRLEKQDASDHRRFLRNLRIDLKESAKLLDRGKARYFVDLYYQIQEFRKVAANQTRAGDEDNEPNFFLDWISAEFGDLEKTIQMVMGAYAAQTGPGRWMQSLYGCGNVMSAGFMAHLDITKAKTAGAFWRFCGLDPSMTWISREKADKIVKEVMEGKKGPPDQEDAVKAAAWVNGRAESVIEFATTTPDGEQRAMTRATLAAALCKRPFNAKAKVLCWKFANTMKKFKGHPKCFYGRLYAERKFFEEKKNERGDNAETAAEKLRQKPNHKQKDILKQGKLAPGHVDLRALRWASKLFLSHLHTVMWNSHYGTEPPKPYVIEHMGHAHIIEVPNWPLEE